MTIKEAKRKRLETTLGIVLKIGFLLGLHFDDGIHVVLMRQLCTFTSHSNHALQERKHKNMYCVSIPMGHSYRLMIYQLQLL